MRGSGIDDLVVGVDDVGEGGLDIRRRDLRFDH